MAWGAGCGQRSGEGVKPRRDTENLALELRAGNRQGGPIWLTPLSWFRSPLGSQSPDCGHGEWGCPGLQDLKERGQVHWFQVKGLVGVGEAQPWSSVRYTGAESKEALRGCALLEIWKMGTRRPGGLPRPLQQGCKAFYEEALGSEEVVKGIVSAINTLTTGTS